MNNLSKALLGGVALCALTTVPAVATSAPDGLHFTALHGGRVVNKTKLHNHGATHVTYTFNVYDYVAASTPLHTVLPLIDMSACHPPYKIVAPKKTTYGKLSVQTETNSTGCEHITVSYKLVKQPSRGDTDIFVISESSKYENNGTKYKGTLRLDCDVEFD